MNKMNKVIASFAVAGALGAGVLMHASKAQAGVCQVGPSATWDSTLFVCGQRAHVWGWYQPQQTTVFGIPITVNRPMLTAWMRGITGVGANQVAGVGVNSSGAVISTCKAIDKVLDNYTVTTSIGACNGGVKFWVQNNY
jgi:hypothetical protein